jgi:hypothetical protein
LGSRRSTIELHPLELKRSDDYSAILQAARTTASHKTRHTGRQGSRNHYNGGIQETHIIAAAITGAAHTLA